MGEIGSKLSKKKQSKIKSFEKILLNQNLFCPTKSTMMLS